MRDDSSFCSGYKVCLRIIFEKGSLNRYIPYADFESSKGVSGFSDELNMIYKPFSIKNDTFFALAA